MNTKKGFIRLVILVVIALIVLGYFFNIKITDVIASPNVQANLNWLWDIIVKIWNFITYPIVFLWNRYVV